MIGYYINGTERGGDIDANSLRIKNQLQKRVDTCDFTMFQGTKPSENQEVRIYLYDEVSSHAGTTINLSGLFEQQVGRFYDGQTIYLQIGSDGEYAEKAVIDSYDEDNLQIILTASPSVSLSSGEKVGILIFGGVISRVSDSNIHSLSQLEYKITCVDYTKIFDRVLIADTWEDEGSRFIINSFLNTTINYKQDLDDVVYANNTALQAVWAADGNDDNAATVDSTNYIESTADDETSGNFSWTNSGGTASWTATITAIDVMQLTGAASGTPTSGKVMIWGYPDDVSNITAIKLRVGSSASDYVELNYGAPSTSADWNYLSMDLADGTVAGTPDWSAVDYMQLIIEQTGDGNVSINGIRLNDDSAFTMFNVEDTPEYADIRSPQRRPQQFIDLLAKNYQYVWYIDYERDIHFLPKETEQAPIVLTDSSNNFYNLRMSFDESQTGNRILIRGGEKTSTSKYYQVFEGSDNQRS